MPDTDCVVVEKWIAEVGKPSRVGERCSIRLQGLENGGSISLQREVLKKTSLQRWKSVGATKIEDDFR